MTRRTVSDENEDGHLRTMGVAVSLYSGDVGKHFIKVRVYWQVVGGVTVKPATNPSCAGVRSHRIRPKGSPLRPRPW